MAALSHTALWHNLASVAGTDGVAAHPRCAALAARHAVGDNAWWMARSMLSKAGRSEASGFAHRVPAAQHLRFIRAGMDSCSGVGRQASA